MKNSGTTFLSGIGVSIGGASGTRTHDPLLAKQVRYQLRHSPIFS